MLSALCPGGHGGFGRPGRCCRGRHGRPGALSLLGDLPWHCFVGGGCSANMSGNLAAFRNSI